MKFKDFLHLMVAVVVSELAGIIGSVFTTSSVSSWYPTLVQPELAPPSWVFGPVWTTLYALMGIAAFLVWKKGWDRADVRFALGLFFVQLVVNSLWSFVFFGAQNIGGALIVIALLWTLIILTIIFFGKLSKTAGWLLVPYLLWVSFASYLNYAYFLLN